MGTTIFSKARRTVMVIVTAMAAIVASGERNPAEAADLCDVLCGSGYVICCIMVAPAPCDICEGPAIDCLLWCWGRFGDT